MVDTNTKAENNWNRSFCYKETQNKLSSIQLPKTYYDFYYYSTEKHWSSSFRRFLHKLLKLTHQDRAVTMHGES